MTSLLRLLFDECVGKPTMLAIAELLVAEPEKPDLQHVLDFQSQGVRDEVWVPKAATEGRIIITADRGKRGGGAKLPLLCRRYGITHVMLSATLHHRKGFEKAAAILTVWPELAKLPNVPKGSGYSLRLTSAGGPHLVLVYSPPPPGDSATA